MRRSAQLAFLSAVISACGAPRTHRTPQSCSVGWPIAEKTLFHPIVGPFVADPSRPETSTVTLPVDWQTLPRSGVVLRRRGTMYDAWIAGDLLIRADRTAAEALDIRTGALRWKRVGRQSVYGSGCGRVIQSDEGGVRGLDAQTGQELWQRDYEPGRARILAVEGCRAVVVPDEYDAPMVVWILDAETGATVARHRFGERAYVRMANDSEVVVTFGADERSLRIPLAGGEPVPVAAGTRFLADQLAIVADEDGVRALLGGEPRWSRSWPHYPPMLQVGNDLVVFADGALRRLAQASGEDRWVLPLPEEASGSGDVVGWAVDGERMVITTDSTPPLLLDVDLAAGRLRSTRLAPFSALSATLAGDLSHQAWKVPTPSIGALRTALLLDVVVGHAVPRRIVGGCDIEASHPLAEPLLGHARSQLVLEVGEEAILVGLLLEHLGTIGKYPSCRPLRQCSMCRYRDAGEDDRGHGDRSFGHPLPPAARADGHPPGRQPSQRNAASDPSRQNEEHRDGLRRSSAQRVSRKERRRGDAADDPSRPTGATDQQRAQPRVLLSGPLRSRGEERERGRDEKEADAEGVLRRSRCDDRMHTCTVVERRFHGNVDRTVDGCRCGGSRLACRVGPHRCSGQQRVSVGMRRAP